INDNDTLIHTNSKYTTIAIFSFSCYPDHRDLHSFPTRRSSDLRPSETPLTKPKSKTAVTLGNIGDLIKELTRLYGYKPLWVTEYGYQTRPPDPVFGVSWKNQSKYLAQAYSLARRNRRIGMFIWFLIRDERRLSGWQSGFFTASGARKPSYTTYRRLKH